MRKLTEEEMDVYRAPYLEAGESRRPTLTWPREIPFDGEPADVHEIVSNYLMRVSKAGKDLKNLIGIKEEVINLAEEIKMAEKEKIVEILQRELPSNKVQDFE